MKDVKSFVPLFYLSSFSIPLQKGDGHPNRVAVVLPSVPADCPWYRCCSHKLYGYSFSEQNNNDTERMGSNEY